MNKRIDDVSGVLTSLGGFEREATRKTFPVSLIALEALKETDPDLAKVIFEEAMIGPMKTVIENRDCGNPEWCEEILARFRQEPLETLYHQLQLRFAETLLADLFENGKQQMVNMDDPVKKGEEFTPGALVLIRSCALETAFTLTTVATEQEREVMLCLASALAGKEAVLATATKLGTQQRSMMLTAIEGWIRPNEGDEAYRQWAMAYVCEHATYEQCRAMLDHLMGTAFNGKGYVTKVLCDVFGEDFREF